jgi:hypothetical protein
MKMGLGSILCIAAVVLFVIAFLSDDNYGDMLALGLAAFAASFVVDTLGLGKGRMG